MPDPHSAAPVHLNKKKAVKRLLCCGIRLFLRQEDELGVHLIASSASKIAIDLYEKERPGLSLIDVHIVPEHKKNSIDLSARTTIFSSTRTGVVTT